MSKEWKLVPVEPTDEMKEAGAPSCEYTGTVCAALCYEAMIAAAPNHIGDAAGMVAPVFERQPRAWLYMNTNMGNELSFQRLDHFYRPYTDTGEHDYVKGVALYAAPPELAELQATIARLESEAVYAAAGFQAAKDEIERLRDELGECKGEYDRAVNKVDALRDQLEQAQADLARMTEGRDGLRSALDEANKVIAWQRTELDQLKKNAGHSALRREAFDKLAQAVAAGAPSGDVYACDSEEPTNKEV
jgi:uncharacterized coiled-coil protein SlyX